MTAWHLTFRIIKNKINIVAYPLQKIKQEIMNAYSRIVILITQLTLALIESGPAALNRKRQIKRVLGFYV